MCQQTSWPLGTGTRRLLELWREFAGVLWYRGTKSSIFVNQTVRLKKKTYHRLSFESRGRGANDCGVKTEREVSRSAFSASDWKRILRAKTFFPITTKDLKNFKGKQAHFVLRFKGQLIYRLVTLGSFAGPGHLNQLLLTLFRMKCYAHSLSFKSERVWNFEISYCWFAPDVMAAMLVVSPLVTQ